MAGKALRKKLADLIRQGKKEYPNVKHIEGDWVQFDVVEGVWEPARACAIGYAILGAYDGAVNRENVLNYASKMETQFQYVSKGVKHSLYSEAVEYNDQDDLSLDEIILALEVGG